MNTDVKKEKRRDALALAYLSAPPASLVTVSSVRAAIEKIVAREIAPRQNNPRRVYRVYYERKEPYLTPREFLFARYVVNGWTNVSIAHKFNLQRRSVEVVLERVYRKLNCRNRRQLAEIIWYTDLFYLEVNWAAQVLLRQPVFFLALATRTQ